MTRTIERGQWAKVKDEWTVARDLINDAVMEGLTTDVQIEIKSKHSVGGVSFRRVIIEAEFIVKE